MAPPAVSRRASFRLPSCPRFCKPPYDPGRWDFPGPVLKSGANKCRPALNTALRTLRAGDVLVVWKLDRLGRSLQDLIAILGGLERRGIGFWSISDQIDTTTAAGRLVFHITGAVAEFEHTLMSERTKAGMQAARRKGREPGRPRVLTDVQVFRVRRMAICDEMPPGVIAREMKVSKTTVWRALSDRPSRLVLDASVGC